MELRGNVGNQAEQDDPAAAFLPSFAPGYQLGVLFLVDRNDLHALVETAVLAHADFLAVLDLIGHAGALVALGAYHLDLAGVDSRLALDDALEIFPFGRAMVTPPRYWQPNC